MNISQLKITTYRNLAMAWQEHDLNCRVVHGLGDYPASVGRDLDLIVPADQLKETAQCSSGLLEKAGFRTRLVSLPWGIQLYGFLEHGDDYLGLEFDFISRMQWANISLVSELAADDGTYRVGDFVIDAWASFAKSILILVLTGQIRRLGQRLHELDDLLRCRSYLLIQLGDLFGNEMARELLDHLEAGNLEWLADNRSYFLKKIMTRGLVKRPIDSLLNVWRWSAIEIVSFFPPRLAPLLELSGSDHDIEKFVVELDDQLCQNGFFAGIRFQSDPPQGLAGWWWRHVHCRQEAFRLWIPCTGSEDGIPVGSKSTVVPALKGACGRVIDEFFRVSDFPASAGDVKQEVI